MPDSSTQSAASIRQDFFDFFEEKQHTIVPSASIVPHGDPTLLFTNAGMNQFKDVFLGTGSRPYKRAADTQKCLRVSGKHNDLEEVGIDTYHHTFFEMLGNWSFGDYFKREAIAWAWDLLVDRWGLEPGRLYATVHEGDKALGLAADDEAAGYWKSETGIDHDHIKYCSSKDNFWMMGDTGPCGPCSEIHVDLRSDADRASMPGIDLVNADDPRVMEVWNLVFIQYNSLGGGELEALEAQHVDTGMGLERIVAVLQGKTSNYDTDLFGPILQRIAVLSPRPDVVSYADVSAGTGDVERCRIAMRAIADHVRAIAFAIADGVVPGNVGRAYVIRRILRRAVRFGYQTLEFREPFLYNLIEPLSQVMGDVFPEIARRRDYIERIVRAEEESFLRTLGTGLEFFGHIVPYVQQLSASEASTGDILSRLESDRKTVDLLQKAFVHHETTADILGAFAIKAASAAIPGEVAFLLHDTYGFPIDLTELMARESGLSVDREGYESLMTEQRERARRASDFTSAAADDDMWKSVSDGEDSVFVGYETTAVEGAGIRLVRRVEGEDEERFDIVLDVTPFYAESGGQIGDIGKLVIGDEEIRVLDTTKEDGRIVHHVERLPGHLDAPVVAHVDNARRIRVMKHHTATHLLHAALRERLGKHVAQKGSLVAEDRLRFDFSHFERVSPEDLAAVEARVNDVIQGNVAKIEETDVPFQEALDRGAMALFGEKYGERVRVITFGPSFSIELCGGTHVRATGELGLLQIVSEGSVAAGVRRIEAVSGQDALRYVNDRIDELDRVRDQFKGLQRPTDEEVADLIVTAKRLEKEFDQVRQDQLASGLDTAIAEALAVDGVKLAVRRVGDADMNMLRSLGERLRSSMGDAAVGLLGTVDPDGTKVYLVATVSDDLVSSGRINAGDIVGRLAAGVGGGGGGRPQLATAGGKKPEALDAVLSEAPAVIAGMIRS